METVKLENFDAMSKEQMKQIEGGMTYCQYLEVIDYLIDHNPDQAGVLMQKFNTCELQLEDWDYKGERLLVKYN